VRDPIYCLLNDLATDTFDGDMEQREALIAALKKNPEWHAEYIRIQETEALFGPESG